MGMGYDVALRQPVGRLLDLMAIEQVKMEGAKVLDNRIYDPDKMSSYDAIPDFR